MKKNKKASTITTKTLTTKSTSTPSYSSIQLECYFNWFLYQGGLTRDQAAAESGSISNNGPSGYWYTSELMTNSMCINSCLKYGFIYAAINP